MVSDTPGQITEREQFRQDIDAQRRIANPIGAGLYAYRTILGFVGEREGLPDVSPAEEHMLRMQARRAAASARRTDEEKARLLQVNALHPGSCIVADLGDTEIGCLLRMGLTARQGS
jgi:hypothetical protein